MASDRIQRRIDQLLVEADQAVAGFDWEAVRRAAKAVLALDPDNSEAPTFLAAAERSLSAPSWRPAPKVELPAHSLEEPTAFANGRYQVKDFLGEGGKKRVYLAHDTVLDRDVALAIIKTEGLDRTSRVRITREAQSMGRLGDHPHVLQIFDLGEDRGRPYMVLPLMPGGDVKGLLETAEDHRLSIEYAINLAAQVCRGLEFAHSKGIVHRDLKPGNVWLASDGTARIGDFGLAVAIDRSRLTQEGMMVGTVSYMPPEQALGGEVDGRSDLYSLGAMLYEMVTGRPPFLGDDSVAIIGQHLNTSPVAPTWHNPEVPTGLEALIMRLLEKEPSNRPASAQEVRKALDAIDPGVPGRSVPLEEPATAPGQDPLYRRTFVGREAELRQLDTAFDRAMSGEGSLLMVIGEPGIGKTSLCEQLATYVALRGGRTLVGHCYEEGSLSLPYLAFVEAMRSYVLERDAEDLKKELGSGAADVARIVSEVRERVQVELSQPGEPEEDRYRLMQAVASFLGNASTMQPLLIVLEDLHDADRGTLDMLTHVARSLSGARLLIVGTYRDAEVERGHPLSGTLADLRRVSSFGRVPLRGLTADEVGRMMSSIAGQDVPWGLAEGVHRQTEGNPLFVQEVLRYLVEEGLLSRETGHWRSARDTPSSMSIPEGLRDVIGKRLARLSQECNSVLRIAAVVGRDFRLDVMQKVAESSEEDLVDALEEARGAAVIEERSSVGAGASFRFAHAFFRQTLYEETFTPRRIRLHQQVGRVLEEVHAGRLEEHASELAEHFAQSTEGEDLAKALIYGEMAAAKAMAVYAYGEAAGHLERCLQVQEALESDDKAKRCDLLLALGQAMLLAEEPLRAAEMVAPEALSLAEALRDHGRAFRSCRMALYGLLRYGSATIWDTEEWRHWAERADHFAVSGTTDRAFADSALSFVRTADEQFEEAWNLAQQALALARSLSDPVTSWLAAGSIVGRTWAARHQEEWLRQAQELAEWPRHGVAPQLPGTFLYYCAFAFLSSGHRDKAERRWGELQALATRTQDAELLQLVLASEATLAHLDGELEAAIYTAEHLLADAEETGVPVLGREHAGTSSFRPLLYLGRAQDALASLEQEVRNAGKEARPIRMPRELLCLAHLGRHDEARDGLQRFLHEYGIGPDDDGTPLTRLNLLLEVAVLLEELQPMQFLQSRLAGSVDLATISSFDPTCVARHVGGASALLGNPDEARSYYGQALEMSEKIRNRPEIALTRLQLAELLLAHYPEERAEALDHLDFAIAKCREMKMQPSLERALSRKMSLQGIDVSSPQTSIDEVVCAVEAERPNLRPRAAPDGTVTILFTDIEGSTAMVERLGDTRAQDVLRLHNAIIREQVTANEGFEVKSQGDGFMVAFSSARRALECGIAIRQTFAAHNGEHPDEPIRVRIGLHTGEAIKEGEDFFGKTVILAARIASQALGEQILVSSLLKALVESSGEFVFGDAQDVELKGLAGSHQVFDVKWDEKA